METQTARKTPVRQHHVPEADALDIAKAALDVSNRALQATTGLETKIDQIITLLGTEVEDGKGGFTSVGLLGRVRRVETTAIGLVNKYRGWFQTFGGFGAAIIFVTGLVTFLVSNHIIKIG